MKDRDYDRWRELAREHLPSLASRIFALRKVGYSGCGFHWSLERSLGSQIKHINDYDEYPSMALQIAIQTGFEHLVERIERIEVEMICKKQS